MKATPELLLSVLCMSQKAGVHGIGGKTVVAVWPVAKIPPTEKLNSLFWAKRGIENKKTLMISRFFLIICTFLSEPNATTRTYAPVERGRQHCFAQFCGDFISGYEFSHIL
jgi:hypothetical protein